MTDLLTAATDALQRGDLDRAAEGFGAVLRTDPDNPAALINLGIVRRHQGRLDDAIETLRHATRSDPRNFRGFANLGASLQQARRLDEAVEAYRAAYRLEPRAVRQIAVNLSSMGTGMIFLDPRDLEAFLAKEGSD